MVYSFQHFNLFICEKYTYFRVREKKIEEEREKEKIKERERRELGKQLQHFKEAQREREQRELVDSRQKEKREEKEALDKIRQQISQDRIDRAARYQAAQTSEEERRRTAQSAQEQLQVFNVREPQLLVVRLPGCSFVCQMVQLVLNSSLPTSSFQPSTNLISKLNHLSGCIY